MKVFERESTLLTTPEVLWALLAEPEGLARLTGLDSLPGLLATSDLHPDEPIQYIAPREVLQPFRFDSGPLLSSEVHLRLDETPKGVRVRLTTTVETRQSLLGFFTLPRLERFIEQRIDRQLGDLAATLRGRGLHHPSPPALTAETQRKIEEAFEAAEPTCSQALQTRLLRAPLVVQSVLRPREIAAQEGLELGCVFQALVQGLRYGVLELDWSAMCPRSSPSEQDGSRILRDGVHCAACGIRHGPGLPHHMEAVFRPRKSIRPGRVDIERLMRGRTPEKMATHKIDLRRAKTFTLNLEHGRYLFESNSGTLLIDVWDGHPPTSDITFHFADTDLHVDIRTAPGEHRFEFVNELTHRVKLSVSKRWRPVAALTATDVFDDPEIARHLPGAFVSPQCEILTGCVLRFEGDVDQIKRAAAICKSTTGEEFVLRQGRRLTAVFRTPVDGLAAAEQMSARQLVVGIGIGFGRVVRLKRSSLTGPAVDRAAVALEQAGRPQFAVHEDDVHTLKMAAEEHGRMATLRERPGRSALLLFAAIVDGAPALPLDALTPLDSDLPTFDDVTSVGGMKVVRTLDKGGVGEVYEVQDDEGNRFAAKVIHPHLATKRFIQLFHKEGYYASQLDHPNIVKTRDWGDEDGRPYLLMELLEGRTLYQRVRADGPLPTPRIAQIMSALLDALQSIHDRNLVHRDIKPHNVFLLDDPADVPHGVKLLDFGLMRPAGRAKDERFAGTPEFMAPEQVELGLVDARADLYALGTLVYYMATGKPLFRGKTRGEGAILRVESSPIDLSLADLGPLEPLLMRALAFHPEERWPSAKALREALDDLRGEPAP